MLLGVDDFYQIMHERTKSPLFKVFLLTFLVGVIANLPVMVNQITNPDGVLARELNNQILWDVQTGRWAAALPYYPRKFLTLPIYTILLMLVIGSAFAVLVIILFHIKSRFASYVVGSVIVSFPTVMQCGTYFYCGEVEILGCLLAGLSVYCILSQQKTQKAKIVMYCFAPILLCIATAMTQGVIGVASALCVSILLLKVTDKSATLKEIFKRIIQFAYLGIISLALYLLATKFMCALYGVTLSDYRGISTAFSISGSGLQLAERIKRMYSTFYSFYFTNEFYPYNTWHMDIVFAILIGIGIIAVGYNICHILKSYNNQNYWRIPVGIMLVICIPMGYTTISAVAMDTAVDFKMLPQMMILFALIIALVERMVSNSTLTTSIIVQWATILLSLLISFNGIILSHGISQAMKLWFNATYAESTRILAAMETVPEYNQSMPVAILGNVGDSAWKESKTEFFNLVKTDVAYWGQLWSSEYNSTQYSWYGFMQTYQGVSLNMASETEVENILNSSDFKEMGIFPHDTGVRIIDGVLTVKLSSYE